MKARFFCASLILLLSGCVTHSKSTDQNTYVYVDGLINQGAKVISLAQYDLHQTGYNRSRPTSTYSIQPTSTTSPSRVQKHMLFSGN